MDYTLLTIIGLSIIFLSTALGALIVFFFKKEQLSSRIKQIFLGFASGVMLSAAVFSLIMPAIESGGEQFIPTWAIVAISIMVGGLFIWGIDKLVPHIHNDGNEEGLPTTKIGKKSKMFLAVTIHNIPEGLAVGIAFGVALASWNANPAVAIMGAFMLAVGTAIQNIPEGAVVALTYKAETGKTKKSFWLGVLSGAVEPVAGVIGLFAAMQIEVIMPWVLAFAAGCMLYVIAEEMMPEMKSNTLQHFGVWAFIIGFIFMMVLDVALA